MIVLPRMRAAERKELKEELIWRGFGEFSANVFAHPEMDSRSLGLEGAPARLLAQAIVFDAGLADDDAPQRLVGLGWDLEDLGKRYRRFVQRFERVLAALREPARARAARLLHRAHAADPRVPPVASARSAVAGTAAASRLAGSAGRDAVPRDLCARVRGLGSASLAVATQLDGPLPPPDASVMHRFGGVNSL